MNKQAESYVRDFMASFEARNQGEPEFRQAVSEVVGTLADYVVAHPYLTDVKPWKPIIQGN